MPDIRGNLELFSSGGDRKGSVEPSDAIPSVGVIKRVVG